MYEALSKHPFAIDYLFIALDVLVSIGGIFVTLDFGWDSSALISFTWVPLAISALPIWMSIVLIRRSNFRKAGYALLLLSAFFGFVALVLFLANSVPWWGPNPGWDW